MCGQCFLYRLRISVTHFPLWTALPSSEYYEVIRLPRRRRWAFPLPVLLHLPVVRFASTVQVPASHRVRVSPCVAQRAVYHPSRRPARRNVWGLPSSQRFSLCMPGPEDPDRPSDILPERCLCIGFQCVQTVAICIDRFDEAVPDFRVCGHPSGLQSSLCTLHMFCSVFCTSSTHATLGTSGWLILTRWGLAPHKKRHASLGAPTPRFRRRQ